MSAHSRDVELVRLAHEAPPGSPGAPLSRHSIAEQLPNVPSSRPPAPASRLPVLAARKHKAGVATPRVPEEDEALSPAGGRSARANILQAGARGASTGLPMLARRAQPSPRTKSHARSVAALPAGPTRRRPSPQEEGTEELKGPSPSQSPITAWPDQPSPGSDLQTGVPERSGSAASQSSTAIHERLQELVRLFRDRTEKVKEKLIDPDASSDDESPVPCA